MNRSAALLLTLVAFTSCHDADLAGPAPRSLLQPNLSGSATGRDADRVTIMTQNLYVGADVDAVISALASPDPSDDVPALLTAIDVLQKTDFPTRASALADEIARARPHVVGLQEVDHVQIDLSGLGLGVHIDQDMLPTLLAALASRNLHYAVAARVTNITTTPFPGISLSDEDAILVDADRVTLGPTVAARTYTLNLGQVAPGVVLKRGFVVIDATIDGAAVRIASTHLESGGAAGLATLRAAQATELLSIVSSGPGPAILVGDFNDTPGSPMHAVVTSGGFTDSWAALRPGVRGFTCCEVPDLSNPVPVLNQRIDYVFVRGIGETRSEKLSGDIRTVGDRPGDRVQGPAARIWASDHAGVVATFGASREVAQN